MTRYSFTHNVPRRRDRTLREQGRELRRNLTPSEQLLWEHLRGSKLGGIKFRRQHIIEPFIVDFYSAEHKLVIEIDGSVHDDAEVRRKDIDRQSWLEARGNRVLRFSVTDVEHNIEQVLHVISQTAGGL